MSRRKTQIVLLCEDTQHEAFARRFLVRQGWHKRAIRVEKAPSGGGSAEQYVRQRYPEELRAIRAGHVDRSLVVMVDGDRHGPAGRLVQLDEACREADVPVRQHHDPVVVAVPTWNVQTGLAYLDGNPVDEGVANYPRFDADRRCAEHVGALAEMCQRQQLREPAPPSLIAACEEYRNRMSRS